MLDLFSGIGGFSLAASWVWDDELEIVAFCEIDKFCQKVLKKHWPDVPIIEDIREVTVERITADTTQPNDYEQAGEDYSTRKTVERWNTEIRIEPARYYDDRTSPRIDLLTGGFPCQPFSCAGKRAGTDDNRYLWPEMLRTIREIKPTWIIAENVGGLFTIENGMVFGQVLSDLEAEGYEVQPFCIPACAKNAPHRRDRFWFVGNRKCGWDTVNMVSGVQKGESPNPKRSDSHAADTEGEGLQGRSWNQRGETKSRFGQSGGEGWQENWLEVATKFCGMAHGVSNRVDRLKSLGNAIVPQVAMEIMKAIKRRDE
jgi:DNA (cytosine-5)-methyltransferase 1